MKASLFLALSTVCAVVLLTADAKAIPLPDTSTCSSNGKCLHITNTSSNASNAAIFGQGTGYGLLGYAQAGFGVSGGSLTGTGVYGDSGSGVGVYGFSSKGNGLVGHNFRTDWAAAAISAIPGSSSGLAIWAGGDALKPGGGSWGSTSDARVKKEVKDFHPGLSELKRLRPVSYKYNGLGNTQDDDNVFVGVIAQELEKVLPSMVKSRKGKLRPSDSDETDIKYVDPSAFTYVLINAVQEQHGVPYAFAAAPGKLARGVPTAHAAPPLSEHISATNAVVWPYAKGSVRGESLAPLAPTAPEAAQRDEALYRVLALVDALRIGRPREQKLAVRLLKEALAHARLVSEAG